MRKLVRRVGNVNFALDTNGTTSAVRDGHDLLLGHTFHTGQASVVADTYEFRTTGSSHAIIRGLRVVKPAPPIARRLRPCTLAMIRFGDTTYAMLMCVDGGFSSHLPNAAVGRLFED